MEFGEMLRRLRKQRELTQEQLAKKAGTHKGYLSGIENGKVLPPAARIIRKLAKALGVSAKEFLLVAYLDRAPEEIKGDLERWIAERSKSEEKIPALK